MLLLWYVRHLTRESKLDKEIDILFLVLQVDFGCGAGSLLDSLLSYPTSLEKVVGVDISQRSLARAAKV